MSAPMTLADGPRFEDGSPATLIGCLARNAAAWRQGKKIANEPLRVKVGERSERIVARDLPAKGRYGLGGSSPTGEHRLKGTSQLRQ